MRRLALLAPLAASCLLAACDGGVTLYAQVVDADGAPIPHARVRALPEDSKHGFSGETGPSGCVFLSELVAPGRYDFLVDVSAAGYQPARFAIPTIEHNRYRIVLARAAQVFNSQAQPLVQAPGGPCAAPATADMLQFHDIDAKGE